MFFFFLNLKIDLNNYGMFSGEMNPNKWLCLCLFWAVICPQQRVWLFLDLYRSFFFFALLEKSLSVHPLILDFKNVLLDFLFFFPLIDAVCSSVNCLFGHILLPLLFCLEWWIADMLIYSISLDYAVDSTVMLVFLCSLLNCLECLFCLMYFYIYVFMHCVKCIHFFMYLVHFKFMYFCCS